MLERDGGNLVIKSCLVKNKFYGGVRMPLQADNIHYSPSIEELNELMNELKVYDISQEEAKNIIEQLSRSCWLGSFREINEENIKEIKNLTITAIMSARAAQLD